MRGPVSVRVNDGTVDRHVSAYTSGLRWKKSAFGGDVDLTCAVTVPRGTFTALDAGAEIVVYDGRIGSVLWQGNLDYPGATDGPAGQSFEIQAFGGAARLQAKRQPLIPIDTSLEGWQRSGNSDKRADTSNDERPDETPALRIMADDGKPIETDWQGEWIYKRLRSAGLEVGRAQFNVDAGLVNANYPMQLRTGTAIDSLPVRDTANANTTATVLAGGVGTGAIPAGSTLVSFRVQRNGSQIDADKHHWFEAWDPVVRQRFVDATGARTSAGYGRNYVYAHEVIEDMVGRGMAPGANPAKASFPSTSFAIDTLAWVDGVTFTDAMNDLLVFEPDLFWMLAGDVLTVGEWDEDNPRYVISKRDGGVTHPGAEFTKCNRVLVTYVDKRGKDASLEVTADVPELDYIRDAEPISLPDGFGSPANARRAGEAALKVANRKPMAGSALIRRRIVDRWRGCSVMPWEIEPGCCVMEQETGDVLRLTEVDCDVATAALTLDKPPRSTEQAIARLERVARRRKK